MSSVLRDEEGLKMENLLLVIPSFNRSRRREEAPLSSPDADLNRPDKPENFDNALRSSD
jgi:hypothetical protein